MKKAFTLVELLIVVVVIAILLSIAFKIAGVGEDSQARNLTIARMQRLENAISGYFAVYGSYPPVALQGRSRNIFYEVNGYGIQQVSRQPRTTINLDSYEGWKQVEAACRAQPVAMQFPYSSSRQAYAKAVSEALKEMYSSGAEGFRDNQALQYGFDSLENIAQLSDKQSDGSWTEVQLFQFGLLSYLLPRYLIMMGYGNGANNSTSSRTSIYDDFAQWSDNNALPCNFETGIQYPDWSTLNADLGRENERWKIALLPTQAVCARWIANLEGTLTCNMQRTIYGVNIQSDTWGALTPDNAWPKIYSAGDSQGGTGTSGSQQYVLDEITCHDGWLNDFYYYSMPPYQSYRIWSAGPNGRTFPPWIPEEQIENDNDMKKYRNTIRNWIADDMVHMSN